jgi:hypothetical protein
MEENYSIRHLLPRAEYMSQDPGALNHLWVTRDNYPPNNPAPIPLHCPPYRKGQIH